MLSENEKTEIRNVLDTLSDNQKMVVYALAGLILEEKLKEKDMLEHHGIKGMKWGVRRYQNYDGSYTRKGLERYKKSMSDYEKTKTAYKNGQASRHDVRIAKRKLNTDYNKLKTDKLADEGKKLYSQGKTITNNTQKLMFSETAVVIGGNLVAKTIASSGQRDLASISGTTISLGGSAINAILAVKTNSENKKLRAYYSHH